MEKLGVLIAAVAMLCVVGSEGSRTLLQELTPFSVAGMPGYVEFVKAGCSSKPTVEPGTGMWGTSKDPKCAAFQNDNGKTSITQFKVYGKEDIYFVSVPNAGVRINMFGCKGTTPACVVEEEGGGAGLKGTKVDISCLINFVKYSNTCYKKKGDAATCTSLKNAHCKCFGAKCGSDSVTYGKVMTCKYNGSMCTFIKGGTPTSG